MKLKHLIGLGFLFFGIQLSAQQLVYRPLNPAFGGDTFNYNWLLNSANAQNSFTAPNGNGRGLGDESGLDRFAETLERQLLSQISRSILGSSLEGGLQPGTFNFGDFSIEIFESEEGLVINILDTNTGEQTQIIAPN